MQTDGVSQDLFVYILRTGIRWKALPREYGSSSSVHRYFKKWKAAGFFLKLWKKELAEYDELEGIASGTNENTNELLREYFQKGESLKPFIKQILGK